METFSALLAICAGNSPVTGEFPTQRPVTRSFYAFFDLCVDKRFETPSSSSWRHCTGIKMSQFPCTRKWAWIFHCPACRTTLIATRFRVAVICPIIQVPHCIRVFFYFVWFVFINHIFQFYYELCTYCNILDIYLSWNLNFVNYVLFYMKLLNYLFFSMFGSVLESCELTGVCLLLPWLIKWK